MSIERIPCHPTPECKYWPDCYEDIHYIRKRLSAQTALEKKFADSDANKLRICRVAHEIIERSIGWPPYPDAKTMRDAL